MEMSKEAKLAPLEQLQPIQGRGSSDDELKRLTDFFSILIQIDRREKVTNTYAKSNK